MDGLNKVLQLIFFFVWIPLGIVLLAVIIFLLVANPFGKLLESLPLGSGPTGGSSGGFPSEEMIKKFMQGSGPGSAPQGQGGNLSR